MNEILWRPTEEQIRGARITAFIEKTGSGSLEELQQRAAQDPAWFWAEVVKDLELEWYKPYEQVLDLSGGIEWPRWFVGGQFNIAHNCLDKHLTTPRRQQPAVIYEDEGGETAEYSYVQLSHEVNRFANALTSLGVGQGDRVALFLPMLPETVVAVLALAKIGAIFTPIFSGFGPQAVASRINDSGAKLLITADGFTRRGKVVDLKATAEAALQLTPQLEHTVVVQRLKQPVRLQAKQSWYHELIKGQPTSFHSVPLDAEAPLMILYTSGTTGRPKGVVHCHAGFPIKAAQDLAHLFDLHEGDRLFWLTDLGWMMGPWAIFGSLLLGATCFLYDGAPDHPGPDRLWQLAQRHGITHLGVSPTLIRALMPHGNLAAGYDLSRLRLFGSTGEPWNPEPYCWLLETIGGGKRPIINYSGGTEVSGGILGCVVTRPLKAASFNCAVPGMAVQVLDAGPGEVGELAITAPWVGMAKGFWQDPERYLESYWSQRPGIWVHGDWASVDRDGFWYIHGRSDDTIMVAGKRLGPAEAESALVAHPAVVAAAAIGVPHPVKGEGLVCFVVVAEGEAKAPTAGELQAQVVATLGRALAPEAIHVVNALPTTRNGKVMRRLLRAAYLGEPLGDLSALENPEVLGEVANLRA